MIKHGSAPCDGVAACRCFNLPARWGSGSGRGAEVCVCIFEMLVEPAAFDEDAVALNERNN